MKTKLFLLLGFLMVSVLSFVGYFFYSTFNEKKAADEEYVEAGNMAWAGYTVLTYTGALGGLKGGNAKCQADWPGSHWATTHDLIRIGSANPWTSNVWVYFPRGSYAGTCGFWTDSNGTYVGAAGNTGASATLTTDNCSSAKKLACVYGNSEDF